MSSAAVLTLKFYAQLELDSANENHLRTEISLLTKEVQTKDETIKKLDSLIEKLQDDTNSKRQALDARVRIFLPGSCVCAERASKMEDFCFLNCSLQSRLVYLYVSPKLLLTVHWWLLMAILVVN